MFINFFTARHSIGECPSGVRQRACACADVWKCEWMSPCERVSAPENGEAGGCSCAGEGVWVMLAISSAALFVLIPVLALLKAVCKYMLRKTNDIWLGDQTSIQYINKCMETEAQIVCTELFPLLCLFLFPDPPMENRRNCPVALLMMLNVFNCVCVCVNKCVCLLKWVACAPLVICRSFSLYISLLNVHRWCGYSYGNEWTALWLKCWEERAQKEKRKGGRERGCSKCQQGFSWLYSLDFAVAEDWNVWIAVGVYLRVCWYTRLVATSKACDLRDGAVTQHSLREKEGKLDGA